MMLPSTRTSHILMAAVLSGLPALQAAAQDTVFRPAPFVMQSDGPGEMASRGYAFSFQGEGRVYARFTAAPTHCASVIAHFRLDGGADRASYPLAAGQASPQLDLGRAAAGPHQVTVVAEGVPGGCNAGRVTSWGGTFEVTLRPADAPPLVPEAGDWFVEVSHRGDWRPFEQGCIVTARGAVFTFHSERPFPTRAEDGRHGQHYDDGYLGLRLGTDYVAAPDLTAAERQGLEGLGGQLRRASSGRLVSKQAAYDAGETEVIGWFRTSDGGYQAVILAERGDWDMINTAPAAGEALQALRAISRADCRF